MNYSFQGEKCTFPYSFVITVLVNLFWQYPGKSNHSSAPRSSSPRVGCSSSSHLRAMPRHYIASHCALSPLSERTSSTALTEMAFLPSASISLPCFITTGYTLIRLNGFCLLLPSKKKKKSHKRKDFYIRVGVCYSFNEKLTFFFG